MKIKIVEVFNDKNLFEQQINNLLTNESFILDSIKVVGGTHYNAEFEQDDLAVVYIAVFKIIKLDNRVEEWIKWMKRKLKWVKKF